MILANITWAQLGEIAGGLAALATIAGLIFAVASANRKVIAKVDQEPPPEFRKAQKRYNHDLFVAQHQETSRRLDGHDAEIEQLWTTMRNEDSAIRRETGVKFDAILLALGEIKGEIKNRK